MLTKELIDHFGGVQKAANALGVSRQMIYQYGDILPETVAYKVEVITNGALRVIGSDYERDEKK